MDNVRMAEIVIMAQAGSQGALTRIYLEHAKSVYFLALKLMKNKEVAEDITQEVFIYVHQKIAELREPGAFRVWLNRITASQCANALRRNREPHSVDIEEVAETEFFEETNPILVPEKAFDNAETARMIIDIIDALPTPQRVCVYYYYYEQLTVAQIAEILDANENTVKSRLALAREKIRKELERLNKEDGIKLYGAVPLLLTPILHMSLREFDMPQNALDSMLVRVKVQAHANPAASAVQQAASAPAKAVKAPTEAVSHTAAQTALSGTAGTGLGIGAKIAIAIAGVAVTGGVALGGMTVVNSLNRAAPVITRAEYARAVEENTALRKRIAEQAAAEAAVPAYAPQDQPQEEALPEPMSEAASVSEPESDVSAPAVIYGRANTDLNLRGNPSTSGEILDMLTSGAVIEIHEDLGEWLRVSIDGKAGFVSAEYVTIIGNTPLAAGSSNTAAYQAYYDVLKSITDKQGIVNLDEVPYTSGHGEIVYAELLYYDNENPPLLFFEEWLGYQGGTHVYSYSGGAVKILEAIGYAFVQLASSRSGQPYIINGGSVIGPGDDSVHYYYSIRNGQLVLELERYTDRETQWFVNGKQVSEDEYNSAPESELGIVEIRNHDFNPDAVRATLAELSRLAGIS